MKHLLLMRHAKSDWNNQNLDDMDRPLNERGLKDAPEMARRIIRHNFIPDLIVSSQAKRAFETAKLVAKQLNYHEHSIDRRVELYQADIDDLVHIIRTLDDTKHTVMIIAHNPTLTSLVGFLSNTFIDNLPTAGIARIEFDMQTWKQTAKNGGKTTWFDFPKNTN